MANAEINDLTPKTNPVGSDEVEIQETSGGTSYKATITNLAKGMGDLAQLDEASAVEQAINQSTHGFSVGDVLRHNGTSYTEAQADAVSTAEAVGMVSEVVDANNFVLTTSGLVTGLSGLTAGTVYFLSDSSAGAITATEPSSAGDVSKPVLLAISTTSGVYKNMRGAEIPSYEDGVWQSYTPSISGSGTALGNGSVTGRYTRIGDTVMFTAKFTLGSASTIGSAVSFSLPLTADTTGWPTTNNQIGECYFIDATGSDRPGMLRLQSSTLARVIVWNTSSTYMGLAATSSTIPHTWATNDSIWIEGTYETI